MSFLVCEQFKDTSFLCFYFLDNKAAYKMIDFLKMLA